MGAKNKQDLDMLVTSLAKAIVQLAINLAIFAFVRNRYIRVINVAFTVFTLFAFADVHLQYTFLRDELNKPTK